MSALEKATRAVAEYFGGYDAMLANKREWVSMRGLDHTNTPVDVNGPFRDDLADIVRDVLMAVREPDDRMREAATQAEGCGCECCILSDDWPAMIDAILNSDAG